MTPAQRLIEYALRVGLLEHDPDSLSQFSFNTDIFSSGCMMREIVLACLAVSRDIGGFTNVFGLALEGIPLATAIATEKSKERDVGFSASFWNRSEKIFGASVDGRKTLIVGYLMTEEDYLGEAVKIVKEHGGIPVGCVVVYDREEKIVGTHFSRRQAFQKTYNIPVRAAATLTDLVNVLGQKLTNRFTRENDRAQYAEILMNLCAYRDQYCIAIR